MAGKKLIVESDLTVFASWQELPEQIQKLLASAKKVSESAYAPYSRFFVGAAVLLKNGVTVSGCNQENAAYPSGLCAERVALFSAHSNYPNQAVKALAIYANNLAKDLEKPVTPCGACRQVISEYEDLALGKIDVYMASDTEVIHANGIDSLLPLRFNLKV